MGEKDEEALAEGMYRGLISGLGDRYADYYTEEEFQELATSQEGYYEGVGITIGQTEEGAGLTIVEVTDGSPAAEAGIQAGDILIAVDGTVLTYEASIGGTLNIGDHYYENPEHAVICSEYFSAADNVPEISDSSVITAVLEASGSETGDYSNVQTLGTVTFPIAE